VSVIEDPCPSSVTLELPPVPSDSVWFAEVQDEEGARRVPLSTEKLVVGSSPSADVVVRDPTVSARHCSVALLGAGVAIEDLGSKNGT
jgi:hypothetical protein